MKELSKKMFKYLQAHNNEDLTSADVGEALGLPKNKIDGAFTASVQNRKLGTRVPAEVELADGTHKPIKLLKLNDAGMAFDVDAEPTTE